MTRQSSKSAFSNFSLVNTWTAGSQDELRVYQWSNIWVGERQHKALGVEWIKTATKCPIDLQWGKYPEDSDFIFIQIFVILADNEDGYKL